MMNLIKQQLEIKQVRLVTPQSTNNGCFSVARFTEENVENLIPDIRVCGVYLIGCCMPRIRGVSRIQHEFRVCYFGRSDSDVKQRLHDHLMNNGKDSELNRYDDRHYFAIWSCDNIKEAYEREQAFYNLFFKGVNDRRIGNGYDNRITCSHAACSQSKTSTAYLPYMVYVDNVNTPAKP